MNAAVNYFLFEDEPKLIPLIQEDRTLEQKIEDAKSRIKIILKEGKIILVATSFGKDSSVLGNIVLTASIEFYNETGNCPHIRFVNSNTLLENPMMDKFSKSEARKVKAFAKLNSLDVKMDIVSPSLSNNYLVNIIGGRTIISMPSQDSKCSVMMKVEPITRHKKRLFKHLGKDNVVTVIGKRTDESAVRGKGMIENGESTCQVVRDKNGELISSPIADFTLDDIFYYIGHVRSGKIKSYSNFDELVGVYRDANGGDCMVNIYASGSATKTGCGSRTGCFVCAKSADDKSMENMLAEEKNSYMKPLNDFREYLIATTYDPAKRNWIARTLNDDGTVNIAPNAYSPDHCEDLLRYALTIDANEREAAFKLGIEPRFQMMTLEFTLGVELLWSRYGYHSSAKALSIWDDIVYKGKRYNVPTGVPKSDNKEFKKLLGAKTVPFADVDFDSTFSGFRDVYSAMADCEDLVNKSGRLYSNAQTDIEFSIDSEGLEMFMCFEYENFMAKYTNPSFNPTQVLHYFVGLGTVTLSKGNHSQMDKMLRMANQIHRLGIRDILNNPVALIQKLTGEAVSDGKSEEQLDMFV
jgi:3'-phosphoadenosine 5'-phosphosulfate sulfotransferase (PAPS reductase)/FAD synthetase